MCDTTITNIALKEIMKVLVKHAEHRQYDSRCSVQFMSNDRTGEAFAKAQGGYSHENCYKSRTCIKKTKNAAFRSQKDVRSVSS